MAPSEPEPIIEWLGRASSGPDALGDKAASLDRLGRMGLRVPPAFCLTTAAFRTQIEAVGERAGDTAAAARVEAEPLAPEIATSLAAAIARLSEAEATTKIRDRQALEIDGTAGTVRLL